MRRNHQGFTLIEIAIVLTLLGLLLGGIWLAAATVLSNFRTQALTQDIIQVVQNTKSFFAGQGANVDTTGFGMSNALLAAIIPTDMISAISTTTTPVVVTPFSTDKTLPAVTASSPATNSVSYTFGNPPQGLPTNACSQLLITMGALTNMQKLGVLTLNGTSGTDLSHGGTVQVTAAQAANACNATGNGNFIQVTFSAI